MLHRLGAIPRPVRIAGYGALTALAAAAGGLAGPIAGGAAAGSVAFLFGTLDYLEWRHERQRIAELEAAIADVTRKPSFYERQRELQSLEHDLLMRRLWYGRDRR